jgi:uncharacterized protein YbaP (TraB family)
MADNKVIFGLEEADDQMFAINLNQLNNDRAAIISAAIEQTTNVNFATELNALLDAWRIGDDDYLYEVLTKPDEEAELSDYTRKYTDRYAIWMNVFDDMLVSSPVEFVLMDVRYLVGINSFLVALQDAGYTVERY